MFVGAKSQTVAYVCVGLGGFIGSVARYAIAVWLGSPHVSRFPWATFVVNCVGCLIIGLITGWFSRASMSEPVRLLLVTGVLGGFTTFSAFGLESVGLLRRGEFSLALLYILGSVLVSLAAVWLGLWLTSAAEA